MAEIFITSNIEVIGTYVGAINITKITTISKKANIEVIGTYVGAINITKITTISKKVNVEVIGTYTSATIDKIIRCNSKIAR